MSIWITGDTHGDWMHRLNINAFPEQNGMTKDDYVIICGDFGLWHDTKQERYNLDWLENKPFTTLFIDGNHENFNRLDNFSIYEWNYGYVSYIRPTILHLKRGEIFNINGKIFFAFGGAASHDIQDGILNPGDPRIKRWKSDPNKMFRINQETWWQQEMPNEEQMRIGKYNLALHGNQVDFIITHCAPSSTQALLSNGFYKPDKLTSYFEEIKQTVDFKKWLFGHYHDNKAVNDKEILLYDQIIRIA